MMENFNFYNFNIFLAGESVLNELNKGHNFTADVINVL